MTAMVDLSGSRFDELEAEDVYVPVILIKRDAVKAAVDLGKREIRYLVDAYYTMQRNRITAAHQLRQLGKDEEPGTAIQFLSQEARATEATVQAMLDNWTQHEPLGVGAWLRAQVGIGPVIATGLMAHIDMEKAPSLSHVWSYAGLNPAAVWEKGQVRPWNARLKVICAFKAGESFVKTQNHKGSIYGKVFAVRRKFEQERNDRGYFEEQALERAKKVSKDTVAYASYSVGKYPAAHLHGMARRYAVKAFISDLWYTWWKLLHPGEVPPRPWAIEFGGHVDQYYGPTWLPPELRPKARRGE